MSPQWLHVPQTEILQLSRSPFVPRALSVHLLGNSGIKYHPTNTAYFHSKPGKWASIWTRIKGRIQFLSLAKDFLVAVIFICCEILHISRVTPCHPSTERNTAHPSWKQGGTPKFGPQRWHFWGYRSLPEDITALWEEWETFLPVIKSILVAQIRRGLWLKYSTFFKKGKKHYCQCLLAQLSLHNLLQLEKAVLLYP